MIKKKSQYYKNILLGIFNIKRLRYSCLNGNKIILIPSWLMFLYFEYSE